MFGLKAVTPKLHIILARARRSLLAEWRTLVYPDGMDKAAFMYQSGHLLGAN